MRYVDGSASVSLDTLEGCEAVVEWFVDESIAAFEDADFQNLKLVGFYWYAELVNYAASDFGEALVQSFNAYVHSKDLGTMWIPYYCAPGMERAVELGFDVACVQNGYAFPKEDSENGWYSRASSPTRWTSRIATASALKSSCSSWRTISTVIPSIFPATIRPA